MSKLANLASTEIFPLALRMEETLIRCGFFHGTSDAIISNLTNLAMAILLQKDAPAEIARILKEEEAKAPKAAEVTQVTESVARNPQETSYAKISPEASAEMLSAVRAYSIRLERAIKQAGLWCQSEQFQHLLVAASASAVSFRTTPR